MQSNILSYTVSFALLVAVVLGTTSSEGEAQNKCEMCFENGNMYVQVAATDCTKFLQISLTGSGQHDCPVGTAFSCASKTCDHIRNVECQCFRGPMLGES